MSDQQTNYTVVARRYRPQAFTDLVGQPHVITALSNAIVQHRVGHAYLFTGARGVGKTSTARIFSKCLNCQEGPTTAPCNTCDICQAVSVGEDVDVIEIDGASNRGIDEIRHLRSNVNVRPSRCRFKIYIIDEVHMLTTPAFNALLKTLEEPPEHVKFIFCTTDPHHIPITVLSRCQRFDFSPVEADEISERLSEIARNEGVTAAPEALALIARRANGSMRDSQSLLEQILAYCDQQITVSDVQRLLGTADWGQILAILASMIDKQPAQVLTHIAAALKTGVDVGQLASQLVGGLRDLMAIRAGCGPNLMTTITSLDFPQMAVLAQRLGLDTIFSMLQIVDGAMTRMQSSQHSRILLEAAALRCCELENLQSLADLWSAIAGRNDSGTITVTAAAVSPAIAGPESPPSASAQSTGGRVEVISNDSEPSAAASKKKEIEVVKSVPRPHTELASKERAPVPVSPSVVSRSTPVGSNSAEDSAAANATKVSEPTAAMAPIPVDEERSTRATPSTIPSVELQVNASVAVPISTPAATTSKGERPATDAKQAASVANGGERSVPAGANETLGSTAEGAGASLRDSRQLTLLWQQTLEELGDMTADFAADFQSIEHFSPQRIKVTLRQPYNVHLCNRPERLKRFEEVFQRLAGEYFAITFEASRQSTVGNDPAAPSMSRRERMRHLEKHPFIKTLMETFRAEVSDYHEPTRRNPS